MISSARRIRRRGIAQHALNTLLDECRRRGIRALQVEVDRDNAAAYALYASFNLRPWMMTASPS